MKINEADSLVQRIFKKVLLFKAVANVTCEITSISIKVLNIVRDSFAVVSSDSIEY